MNKHSIIVFLNDCVVDMAKCNDLMSAAYMAKYYRRKYRFADGYKVEHDNETTKPDTFIMVNTDPWIYHIVVLSVALAIGFTVSYGVMSLLVLL